MVNVRLDLPKQLENQLDHLKKLLKNWIVHVKEALIRYLEDMEDIRDIEKYLKKNILQKN